MAQPYTSIPHIALAALMLTGLPVAAPAQVVGNGAAALPIEAACDHQAPGKGLLIPQLDSAARTAIATPPDGLLVFQTNGRTGFWYAIGGTWIFVPDKARCGNDLGNAAGSYPGRQELRFGPNQPEDSTGRSGLLLSDGGATTADSLFFLTVGARNGVRAARQPGVVFRSSHLANITRYLRVAALRLGSWVRPATRQAAYQPENGVAANGSPVIRLLGDSSTCGGDWSAASGEAELIWCSAAESHGDGSPDAGPDSALFTPSASVQHLEKAGTRLPYRLVERPGLRRPTRRRDTTRPLNSPVVNPRIMLPRATTTAQSHEVGTVVDGSPSLGPGPGNVGSVAASRRQESLTSQGLSVHVAPATKVGGYLPGTLLHTGSNGLPARFPRKSARYLALERRINAAPVQRQRCRLADAAGRVVAAADTRRPAIRGP